MGILTLVRYLCGSREAIREIAGNRHALWIGFLFVLSAGFAREYDGEDLLHEPWYVVIPVFASLVTSLILFTCAASFNVEPGTTAKDAFTNFLAPEPRPEVADAAPAKTAKDVFTTYLSFLGLFWMTAPLAWLYAIPYEQFLSPADAMRANLATLAFVAAWRVALMVRVLVVLFRFTHAQAFFLVMTFATTVALVLIAFLPVPLIDVMGGIRLSERDRVMRRVALAVGELGCFSMIAWVTGLAATLWHGHPPWQPTVRTWGRPGTLPWLALASLAVWPFVLPHTQPPQQRRRAVEKLYAKGHVAGTLDELSRHAREDYPPGWDPPPRQFSLTFQGDELLVLFEELAKEDRAAWVREAYLDRLADAISTPMFVDDEYLKRLAGPLGRIPGGHDAIDRGLERLREHYTPEGVESMRRALKGEPPEKERKGIDNR